MEAGEVHEEVPSDELMEDAAVDSRGWRDCLSFSSPPPSRFVDFLMRVAHVG
jgi:hypothetical protein